MKKIILFNLLLGLLVVNIKADYREDYQNACRKLNEKLIKDETGIKPKTEIKSIAHFFMMSFYMFMPKIHKMIV